MSLNWENVWSSISVCENVYGVWEWRVRMSTCENVSDVWECAVVHFLVWERLWRVRESVCVCRTSHELTRADSRECLWMCSRPFPCMRMSRRVRGAVCVCHVTRAYLWERIWMCSRPFPWLPGRISRKFSSPLAWVCRITVELTFENFH